MGKYRNCVFVVVYKKNDDETKYLLLKRKLHWRGWEFPKGGVEKGESLLNAVKREVFEETGLHPIKIKKFNIKGKYNYKKMLSDRKGIIGQRYTLFSAEVRDNKKIKLDTKEHSGYKWFDFKKAIEKLTWENQKKCLALVDLYINGA